MNCLRMLLVLAALLWVAPAYGQISPARLLLTEVATDETPFVDDDAYPQLRLIVTPVNEAGVPIPGLPPGVFQLTENGTPTSRFDVTPVTEPDEPVSLLLLLDVSGRMAPELDRVKAAIPSLYDQLQAGDESGVIAFSRRADGTAVNLDHPFPQLDPAHEMNFTNDGGALINLINALQVETDAGAPLYDALYKGVRLTATQAQYGRRAIILITNGADVGWADEPTGSMVANADIAIEEARRFGLPIFTIGLGDGVDAAFLQRAALLTGGDYFQLASPDPLGDTLINLAQLMKHQYHISYQAQRPADDELRTLTVTARTPLGVVTQAVDFRARYPAQPEIRRLWLLQPDHSPIELRDALAVRGMITIEPEIVARHEIGVVQYYFQDQETAVGPAAPAFTATEPPYTFRYQTGQLPAGQGHELVVVVQDKADPPQVGSYRINLLVQPCNLLCRAGLRQQLDPLIIVTTLLVLLLLLSGLLIVRSRALMRRAAPAVPGSPAAPPTPLLPLRPKSTVVQPDTPPIAGEHAPRDTRLVDKETGQTYYLSIEQTTLGRAPDNRIVLMDASVADHHACILWQPDGRFVLYNFLETRPTWVNGQSISEWPLENGDLIQIGAHQFVFQQD